MAKSRRVAKNVEELVREQSLADFLRESHPLIAVLGIFIGLVAFIGNLQLGALGDLLSLLFLVSAVLIWLEIWANIPKDAGTWRLRLFEALLTGITGTVAIYWFSLFQAIWDGLYTLIFLLCLLWLFATSVKRFGALNKIYRTEPTRRNYVRIQYLAILALLLFSVLAFYQYETTGFALSFLNFFRAQP